MSITPTGWLFDAYPLKDKLILWIKGNKETTRIEQDWTSSIYVASDYKHKLKSLRDDKRISKYIKDTSFVNRFEKVSDSQKSKVLKLTLRESSQFLTLAKMIESFERFGVYRLYNVDVAAEQSYFYENNIFPLGKYKIYHKTWYSLDDITSTNYKLPSFKSIELKIIPDKKQKLAKFSDKIHSIVINDIVLQSDSEEQLIIDFVNEIKKFDPDFVMTNGGDSFDFPYLMNRAQKNKVSDKLVLGRENSPLGGKDRKGSSYFSYGRIYYKPTAIHFQGRIHIDKSNCFIWEDSASIEGLYEISRTCRLPLQAAARASIGKCMSSIQFYNATKRGLIIPWKPTLAEIFKTRMDLLIGDRGGLILEPRIGVHENVAELDFASLFASIMMKKNISAETINCNCCSDSQNFVPELQYHICKRQGIVPQSLRLLLQKRAMYTSLINSTKNKGKLKIYAARKSALKWILVTSFGYLGFNNAKFGRIDAHMAVCAFARQLLLQAIHIAEKNGCKVLHGIVDSMWLYKKGATKSFYENIQKQIEKQTGFDLSLDLYRWIVFLPSKEHDVVPVPNRYFGATKTGSLKIRGIEARRHDTPEFFKKCQLEILELFAACKTRRDVQKCIGCAKKIQKRYEEILVDDKISKEQLAFTNRVSKNAGEFQTNTIQADAVKQLKEHGNSIKAGQKIRYIINDFTRKRSKRVVPLQIIDDNAAYDASRYAELLNECCKTVTDPFL